ncbi:alpha/beta hydrolase [Novosphingobium clariflavum]|uniref:Alpha/beta hydrolase n=1 Tax=Novosphingobium clariflavum TaxID=2029884 RepID=A0ABV6SBH3_9SPHN|nr:dienelactone hydrolase family protein [Novosphingobium clariflavum]
MSTSLVILLHGVGSNGADLAGLGQLWRQQLPEARFVSPDAPFAFDGGGAGRQWFSLAGVTADNRPARVEAARAAFDGVIAPIVAAQGFEDRLDRVALVGFSQGTIMALDAVVSGRWPVAALLGYSGRLASPGPLEPSPQTRVALIHGGSDPVIPPAETTDAAARLSALGIAADSTILPGLGHTISREGAEIGAAFLAAALAPTG